VTKSVVRAVTRLGSGVAIRLSFTGMAEDRWGETDRPTTLVAP